jgi:hypothetical protein
MVNIVRAILGLNEDDGKEIAKAAKQVKKKEKKEKKEKKAKKAEKPKKEKPPSDAKVRRVEAIRRRIESQKETKEEGANETG